ncbi:MAG: hypothetical protein GY719_25850 [bacterium]|nr:hypothetical protein [bacterium]
MTLADLFKAARGVEQGRRFPRHFSRDVVIERLGEIPDSPEWIDVHHLKRIEDGCRPAPVVLRYLAAACGLSLVACLKAEGLWPPVGGPRAEMIVELVESLGGQIMRREGRRVGLILPED